MKIALLVAIFVATVPQASAYKLEPLVIPHSIPSLGLFWKEELELMMSKQLLVHKLPFADINDRFLSGNMVLVAEFRRPVSVEVIMTHHPRSKDIEISSGLDATGKIPSISIFLPALKATFDRMRASGFEEWREMFLNHVLVVFMHEMEHLRFRSGRPRDGKFDLDEESRAWHETCLHVLSPLIEDYKRPIHRAEGEIYAAWIKAGKNPADPTWRELIARRHGVVAWTEQ